MREPLVDRMLNAYSRLLFVGHGMSADRNMAYEIAAQLIAFFVRWIVAEALHVEEEVNFIVVPIVGCRPPCEFSPMRPDVLGRSSRRFICLKNPFVP